MCQTYLFSLSTLLLFFFHLHNGTAQIAIFDMHLENLLQLQQGIGWPLYLPIAEGNEALMRLTATLENQQTCEVTTPAGVTFNVRNPPNNRYESWTDGCGVRVRNVVPTDTGRWRLTATRGNESLTGWSEVYVHAKISNYTSNIISLQDGQSQTNIELTSLNNSYCLVAQPFSDSSLVSGHCQVTLDRTTRAVQGRWNVLLGIPGQVTELHVERTVAVEAERLDVGYVREARKLNLYCNILHTAKNVTFCRFQKTTAASGFNVIDGLSDGRYSYYGEGFFKRQCGMTIESVTADDYVTWRCTVGVQEWVGTTIQQRLPLQALISVPTYSGTSTGVTRAERASDEVKTLFVQNDSSLTISCQADTSLAYCWLQHPNGSQFTPVERQLEGEQDFWYTGENLQTGDCGVTFAHISEEDSGTWICHMGDKYNLGVEIIDSVNVKVTGPLAAHQQEVGATIGGVATLYCHTSNGPRPLDYCRFLSPNFVGISVDSSITAETPILGRFYFTPERELDYGDCSLTISPVLEEDFGQWTCAGLLHDHTLESRDTISVFLGSTTRAPRLLAGLLGMAGGIVVLALVFAGAMWYKKGAPIPWRRTRLSNQTDVVSMEVRNDRINSTSSGSTNSSNFNVDINTTYPGENHVAQQSLSS